MWNFVLLNPVQKSGYPRERPIMFQLETKRPSLPFRFIHSVQTNLRIEGITSKLTDDIPAFNQSRASGKTSSQTILLLDGIAPEIFRGMTHGGVSEHHHLPPWSKLPRLLRPSMNNSSDHLPRNATQLPPVRRDAKIRRTRLRIFCL